MLCTWAAIVAVTGGFRVDVGPLRVSSRSAGRVLLLAAAAAALAWRFAYRDTTARWLRQAFAFVRRLDTFLRNSSPHFNRAAAPLVWTFAAALFVFGIRYGSRAAGGADAFGYMSAAALWADGLLAIDLDGAQHLPGPTARGSFVPLAYHLGVNNEIGPTVAPGLPLLMALAGMFSNCGPYLLVPAGGAVLVLATFYLGRQVFDTAAAFAGAALIAFSPVVVFESLVVGPDVPVAAFLTCALAAALSNTARGTLLSGILAGITILIRPNLLPLTVFPWLLILARSPTMPTGMRRTALFAAGSVPAGVFIAWVNDRLFGSPLSTGYGNLAGAFTFGHVMTNLRQYSGWWLESQGGAAFLFFAALFRPGRARMREFVIVVAYAVCAVLFYLLYVPFDQWWYLRFLIPALPIVFLLCADAVNWATVRSPLARLVVVGGFLAAAAAHATGFIGSKDILTNRTLEQRRYVDPAMYIDRTLPADAVVLAMQHSGSVRYYTGRLTLRWDVLEPAALDSAVETLRGRGLPAYALLESWEEEDFRRRFAGQRTVAALSSGAIAKSADGEMRLYVLSSREREPPVAAAALPAMPVGRDDHCVGPSPRFARPEAQRRLALPAGH